MLLLIAGLEKWKDREGERNLESRELVKALGIKSYLSVPLQVRNKTLGSITLVQSESGRSFTQDDLWPAKEVAMRAALAIDNALLYSKAREAIIIRDQFMRMATRELKNPLTSLTLQIQMVKRLLEQKLLGNDFTQLIEEFYIFAYLKNNDTSTTLPFEEKTEREERDQGLLFPLFLSDLKRVGGQDIND